MKQRITIQMFDLLHSYANVLMAGGEHERGANIKRQADESLDFTLKAGQKQ